MRTRLAMLSFLGAQFLRAQPLVIERVTVIDATGKPAQPNITVVIEGGRIASVTPATRAKTPKGAQVVDGSGKFLIPGLWDMHVHGTATVWSYGLYLANGVVGVREMWGPEDANGWRAQTAASQKPAPSIYVASPIIDGPQPVRPRFIAVHDEAQGREVVDRYKDHGSDFIKVYSKLPRDVYFAIADQARKRGIPFEGHVPYSVTAAEASDAGQRTMEHLMGLAVACSKREEMLMAELPEGILGIVRREFRAFETYDDAKAQSLFARFVRNGTWQTPTLTVYGFSGHLNDPQFLNDDRLKYIPKEIRNS